MGGHNKNYPNRDVIRTFEPTSLLSVLLQHGTNYQIVLSMHQPCNHWNNLEMKYNFKTDTGTGTDLSQEELLELHSDLGQRSEEQSEKLAIFIEDIP
jgi:hypothetical protein